jgi:antitoxin VapB
MPVNIKNERVERLLDEVAALTGETKTEAIRRALEERRERLLRDQSTHPVERLRQVLEREVWPNLTPAQRRPLTRAEEDELLGYGPEGV